MHPRSHALRRPLLAAGLVFVLGVGSGCGSESDPAEDGGLPESAAHPVAHAVTVDYPEEGSIFPPAKLPMESTVFIVTSRASVDDVTRTVEAVVDVSNKTEPRLLSWRTR